MSITKREVRILLADYMNFLPPGPQDAFVSIVGGGGIETPWPITAELEKRMDKNSLVGSTYHILDRALNKLADSSPVLYSVLLRVYLREDSGHRDLDHIKKNSGTSYGAMNLVAYEDAAIQKLVEYIDKIDMYVRMPQKAAGPRPGQNMEEKHNELFAIYTRNIDDGLPHGQALSNAVFKMTDDVGNPYYSKRHAARIVKARLDEQA